MNESQFSLVTRANGIERDGAAQRVFDEWVARARDVGVLSTRHVEFTAGRRAKVMTRLREGYTPEQLIEAVSAALASDFHRSNARWCDLASILGSAQKVDRHLMAAQAGSEAHQSARRVVERAGVMLGIDG